MKIRLNPLGKFPGGQYSGTPLEIVLLMQKDSQDAELSLNSFMKTFRSEAMRAGYRFRPICGKNVLDRSKYFILSILNAGMGTLIVSPRNKNYI